MTKDRAQYRNQTVCLYPARLPPTIYLRFNPNLMCVYVPFVCFKTAGWQVPLNFDSKFVPSRR